MTDNFIQLNESNLIRFKIKTDKGEYTGEELVFDLEDIELPLKYQDLLEKDKKNKEWLKNQFLIIDRRKDVRGKKLLSKNEEDKYKALNDFFKKEAEIYDIFLGKDGVKKLLNGRNLGWTTLNEIDEIIEKYISPKLNVSMEDITKKIKDKYSQAVERNKETLTANNLKDGLKKQFMGDDIDE